MIVIAGPCVVEDRGLTLEIAQELGKIKADLNLEFYFKASHDKANRTGIKSYRGPGFSSALETLGLVKDMGLDILTDVHEVGQVAPVANVVDVLQVPALLCRQTDLLLAVAGTGKVVNVKKGQFMAPEDTKYIVQKLYSVWDEYEFENKEVWLTERGTTFGYHNLIVDMRSIPIMKQWAWAIMDCTHSCQSPGSGSTSSGDSSFALVLARAGMAAGADGLFLETHPNPTKALSDGPNMIPLDKVHKLLHECKQLHNLMMTFDAEFPRKDKNERSDQHIDTTSRGSIN